LLSRRASALHSDASHGAHKIICIQFLAEISLNLPDATYGYVESVSSLWCLDRGFADRSQAAPDRNEIHSPGATIRRMNCLP
jgi:hypothetical protein